MILAGANLDGAAMNSLGSTFNITITAQTSEQITATFEPATNAEPGAYSIAVTTAAGASNAQTFYVTPYLQSITLADGTTAGGSPGNGVSVILAGFGLSGATLNLPGNSGLSLDGTPTVTETQITVTINIAGSAAPGPVELTVSVGDFTSNSVIFTVNNLISIEPSTMAAGGANLPVSVTLNGVNLTDATINVTGPITAGVPSVSTPAELIVPLTILDYAGGTQVVTVTVDGVTSNELTFLVEPYIESIDPTSKPAGGTSFSVTLKGQGLTNVNQLGEASMPGQIFRYRESRLRTIAM